MILLLMILLLMKLWTNQIFHFGGPKDSSFPSSRYSPNEYVLLTDEGEPECYEEAMEDEHKNQWIEAMQDEMKSLHENHTYELVKLPKGMRALKNNWVFKVKVEKHNLKPRYKARLVVKGFGKGKVLTLTKYFLLL